MDEINNKDNNSPVIEIFDKKVIDEEYSALIPEDAQSIRNYMSSFNPEDDRYRNSLVGEVYVAAKKAKSSSAYIVAKYMGMSVHEYKYYLDKYPEFAGAMRAGLLDGREEAKQNTFNALYQRALGTKIVEKKTESKSYVNADGVMAQAMVVETTTEKEIPPDPTAAMKILERFDSSWAAKQNIDINVNGSLSATAEDISYEVDYRKLSPAAIKELLASQKDDRNEQLLKDENNKTVGNCQTIAIREEKPEELKDKRKRPMSQETKDKIRAAFAKKREEKEKLKNQNKRGSS